MIHLSLAIYNTKHVISLRVLSEYGTFEIRRNDRLQSHDIKQFEGIVIIYASLELIRQNLNEEECGQ